jgi:hypothetical protein
MIRIVGNLREDLGAFMIISRSILLRMRNILEKNCKENENTVLCPIRFFFFSKSCWV